MIDLPIYTVACYAYGHAGFLETAINKPNREGGIASTSNHNSINGNKHELTAKRIKAIVLRISGIIGISTLT